MSVILFGWKKVLYLVLWYILLGLVVQSIISLTLMTNTLTVVAKVFSNTLIFFAAKMWVAFAMIAKATHIFFAKNINVFTIFQDRNFKLTLANNFIKFWQLGPDFDDPLRRQCQWDLTNGKADLSPLLWPLCKNVLFLCFKLDCKLFWCFPAI